ncbi:MAG: CDP-alcohol phosphatidyltransferase family protein, partial [Deltaproteobacteria bacterium]|nr:CDP-alcohol phosphatidyltransferase family protein [Deltaproteobacteria bacterium]
PFTVLATFFLIMLVAFYVKTLVYGMPNTKRISEKGETVFLGRFFMEYWFWLVVNPIQKIFVNARLSPDIITIVSLFFGIGAGVAFHYGWFALAGWLIFAGGTCDILDGAVARALKTTRKSGAFLDSNIDRFTEIFTFAGLASYYNGTPVAYLVYFAIAGSLMVSYTRARAEALNVDCKVGNMQRAERIVYTGFGAVLAPVVSTVLEPASARPLYHLMVIAILIIAVFSNITAVRRFFYTLSKLREIDRANNK